MLKQAGDAPLGVEGVDEGRWVLIDCNDVVCHVFAPQAREHYDLERLWRDASPIDLGLPAVAVAEASGGAAR
jgi:ribosome-associated protein